ncbi:hypothetical protein LXL04_008260 [Taraxacum kok-saghyz]
MRLNTSVNGSTQWIPSIDCASVSIDLRIRYHMNVGILDVCKNEYIPNISGQRVVVQEQKEEQDFPIENVVTIQM